MTTTATPSSAGSSPTSSSRAARDARGRTAAGPPPTCRRHAPSAEPVVITGAALGLPGAERVFDDENIARILHGEQFIDTIPHRFRQRDGRQAHHPAGQARGRRPDASRPSTSEADVIKLAGRHAPFDLVEEFGVDADRDAALDA